jgi:hypothetical protein
MIFQSFDLQQRQAAGVSIESRGSEHALMKEIECPTCGKATCWAILRSRSLSILSSSWGSDNWGTSCRTLMLNVKGWNDFRFKRTIRWILEVLKDVVKCSELKTIEGVRKNMFTSRKGLLFYRCPRGTGTTRGREYQCILTLSFASCIRKTKWIGSIRFGLHWCRTLQLQHYGWLQCSEASYPIGYFWGYQEPDTTSLWAWPTHKHASHNRPFSLARIEVNQAVRH